MQKQMELHNQANKIRIRITTQRDMGRSKARVKQKSFQPVTKLFHTTVQGSMNILLNRKCQQRV